MTRLNIFIGAVALSSFIYNTLQYMKLPNISKTEIRHNLGIRRLNDVIRSLLIPPPPQNETKQNKNNNNKKKETITKL